MHWTDRAFCWVIEMGVIAVICLWFAGWILRGLEAIL